MCGVPCHDVWRIHWQLWTFQKLTNQMPRLFLGSPVQFAWMLARRMCWPPPWSRPWYGPVRETGWCVERTMDQFWGHTARGHTLCSAIILRQSSDQSTHTPGNTSQGKDGSFQLSAHITKAKEYTSLTLFCFAGHYCKLAQKLSILVLLLLDLICYHVKCWHCCARLCLSLGW